jgi:hypothetical protein
MELKFFNPIWMHDKSGFRKDYLDLLQQDGKTIRIRKIIQQIGYPDVYVYYDKISQPEPPVRNTDRFSDLDLNVESD